MRLNDLGLASASAKALVTILERNPDVANLDLSSNSLGDEGIETLAHFLDPSNYQHGPKLR